MHCPDEFPIHKIYQNASRMTKKHTYLPHLEQETFQEKRHLLYSLTETINKRYSRKSNTEFILSNNSEYRDAIKVSLMAAIKYCPRWECVFCCQKQTNQPFSSACYTYYNDSTHLAIRRCLKFSYYVGVGWLVANRTNSKVTPHTVTKEEWNSRNRPIASRMANIRTHCTSVTFQENGN